LNQDIYFRTFDLTGINVFINGNSFKIKKFKTHLKNRYLIKFEGLDSISDIEAFRNQNIYITSEQINTFISNGLPWPGFFIGKKLNDKYIVKNVVEYIVTQIVENEDEVKVEVATSTEDKVAIEVRTSSNDMGRVIGKRGRVARAIRTVAQAAADEEGLDSSVEFID
jgi:hypothetical protein